MIDEGRLKICGILSIYSDCHEYVPTRIIVPLSWEEADSSAIGYPVFCPPSSGIWGRYMGTVLFFCDSDDQPCSMPAAAKSGLDVTKSGLLSSSPKHRSTPTNNNQ